MNKIICKIKVLPLKRTMTTIILLLCTYSQAQAERTTEVSLVGSWIMDQSTSLAGMSTEDKQLVDASPEFRSQLYQKQSNRILTFEPNGYFSQSYGAGNKMEGKWQLQGQTLTISSVSGNLWVQQVLQLSPTHLTLQQLAKGEAQPMLPILYFTKFK